MSAPDTNIEKQTKRHRPALWGMGTAIALVAAIVYGYLMVFGTDDATLIEAAGITATN